MKLEKLLAVSGMSGLYRMIANRKNGLIVEEIGTGKHRFAPSRKHQFTPLESIAIYTDDGESTELANVFRNMLDQLEDNPPADTSAGDEDIKEYFADVLPNYDHDRVRVSDMRKVIKWFNLLHTNQLLDPEAETTEDEEE